MPTYLTFVHALSPLHAGTGQGVGVIDLPIARERATGLPYLPGSSLKGPLRDACPENDCEAVFGSKKQSVQSDNYAQSAGHSESASAVNARSNQEQKTEHAGAVQFSDQRLLLLPVRSLAGTFAWVTSPLLLQRLLRDAQDCAQSEPPTVPTPALDSCYAGAALVLNGGTQVVLEDLDFKVESDDRLARWAAFIGQGVFPQANDQAWQTTLAERICLVHDDVLRFLLTTATEVIARISLLEQTKTVSDGGLWYEEALPAETVLSGVALVRDSLNTNGNKKNATAVLAVLQGLTGKTTQFGGKATVGRGLCRVHIADQSLVSGTADPVEEGSNNDN
jgi:CRISPR-associated protein Cmr4